MQVRYSLCPLIDTMFPATDRAFVTVYVSAQTADQGSIERLAGLLAAADPPIAHHLWIEQPENVPTCLALAPNRRDNKIKKALDKSGARLWKG